MGCGCGCVLSVERVVVGGSILCGEYESIGGRLMGMRRGVGRKV